MCQGEYKKGGRRCLPKTEISMAKQPKHDVAIDEIKALEDRRYRAMIAGDAVALDELCSRRINAEGSATSEPDSRS